MFLYLIINMSYIKQVHCIYSRYKIINQSFAILIHSMSHIKTYKVLIDSVTIFDTDSLDVANVIVEIKQKNGKIIKTIPLHLISKATFIVQTNQDIVLLFSLLENHSLGSRQPRAFADGVVTVGQDQFQTQQKITFACTIKNIISKKTLVVFAVSLKQDLEKINCQIPDSEGSQEQQTDKQVEQPVVEPQPKKISPIKRVTKRPIRTRHFEYSVKNQSSNHQLNNIVTEQSTNYVQNLRIDIDEAISSIEFYGRNRSQSLAEILFKTNPSVQELRQLKIKVPEYQKIIDIHLKTIEGNKLISSTSLPNLDDKQCRAIQCNFRDEKNQVKGRMKFNYKQIPLQADHKMDKMDMAKQISMFERKKLKQQLNCMPFLFPEPKQLKSVESPRFKLPKIQKQPNIVSQTINEKIVPPDTSVSSPRHKKLNNNTHNINNISLSYNPNYSDLNNSQSQQLDYKSKLQTINRPARSRTIHHRDLRTQPSYKQYIYNSDTNMNTRGDKNIVKIIGVSIKFYKSYLQKRQAVLQIEPFIGKTLHIYSNPNQIFRSQAAYASKILNWNLRNCEIQMNQFENITFQLNLYKQKTLVGQLVVSYNQLKFNQEENSLYFGYLTNNQEVIAKICVDFRLIEGDLNRFDRGQTTLQRTQRRPRMKRLYSEDNSLNQDLYYNRDANSPSKGSLYQSLVIPEIPQVPGKQRKKKRISSPKKKLLS